MKNILIVSGHTDLAGTENFESASRKARVPARKSTFDERFWEVRFPVALIFYFIHKFNSKKSFKSFNLWIKPKKFSHSRQNHVPVNFCSRQKQRLGSWKFTSLGGNDLVKMKIN